MAEAAARGFQPGIPERGMRCVMLTLDERIDRRIVVEAESLIEHGFDTYVLAVPSEHAPPFGYEGERVPVERVDVARHGPFAERVLMRGLRKDATRALATKLLTAYRIARAAAGRIFDAVERSLQGLGVRDPGVLVKALQLSSLEYAFFRRLLFYRPDVVHVHDQPLLRIGVAIRAATGARLVYDMHEYYPEQSALSSRDRKRVRAVEARHIRHTDARFTVNPLLAAVISEAYGIEVGVVQNAIVAPRDLHKVSHDRLRAELSIPSAQRILLYQGWIAPNRNLENLVASMALVTAPVVLVILGYGEYRRHLERIAAEHHVGGRLVFAGAKGQDELLDYTASADVGVIPYPRAQDLNTTYVSPNKLYEFIVARLPMLSNDLPFVRSVIEPNGFGVVSDLETAEATAAAIQAFPYDELPRFRANLERLGHAWTWQAEERKLIEIYDELLRR